MTRWKHYENQSGEGSVENPTPMCIRRMRAAEWRPTRRAAAVRDVPPKHRPRRRPTRYRDGFWSDRGTATAAIDAARFFQARTRTALRDARRDADLPPELVRKLGELGVLASMVDPRFGGSGLDYVSLGIAHEEIARGDFNAAYVLLIAALVGAIVARNGDERQQAAFLPPICRGDFITALAVTEPSGGSDAAHIKMQARRDGDTYILNGEKTSISFSRSAATALVMARTGTLEQGARGVSAFYVDLNSPGVARTRFRDLGSRAVGRGSYFSIRCACPPSAASAPRAWASSR